MVDTFLDNIKRISLQAHFSELGLRLAMLFSSSVCIIDIERTVCRRWRQLSFSWISIFSRYWSTISAQENCSIIFYEQSLTGLNSMTFWVLRPAPPAPSPAPMVDLSGLYPNICQAQVAQVRLYLESFLRPKAWSHLTQVLIINLPNRQLVLRNEHGRVLQILVSSWWQRPLALRELVHKN